MAFQFFSGFETGDASEFSNVIGTTAIVTSPVVSGNYAGKASSTGGQFSEFRYNTLPSGATYYIRVRVRIHINTIVPSTQDINLIQTVASGGAIVPGALQCEYHTDGTIYLILWNDIIVQNVGAIHQIQPDTWYLIEFKNVVSATAGVLEFKINGAIQESFSNQNTGTNNIVEVDLIGRNVSTGSVDVYFDDLAVSSSDYPGYGASYARQGKAGTPTYDSFTKVGGSDAATNWSETPFSGTNACTSIVNGGAQTMLTASFGTIQSGHGNDYLWTAKGLVINACKTAAVMKVAIATNHSIRRRLAGADTDTSVAVTTSDAYFDDGIWTDTLANLNSSEIGILHGANVNLLTVEDMWLLIDVQKRWILGPH